MNTLVLDFMKALEGDFGWLIELGSILLLVFTINIALKWFLLKLHAHFKDKGDLWKDSLIIALIKPLTSLVWLIALVQALNFFWIRIVTQPLIATPHAVIKIGGIIAVAWFFLRWKKVVVHRMLEKSKISHIPLDHGKVDAINKVLTLAIYLVSGLLLLEQTGSSMNTLIAFGGLSGLAFAFASQQIIANFFGGVMIYITHPFTVGDWIQLPEKDIEGNVEEIGWYTTRVRTFDKRPIYIPNTLLTNILVTNPSRMTHRQFKEVLSLRSQDLKRFPAIISDLEEFFETHNRIDQKIPPQVHFGSFGHSGVDIHITVYTTEVDKYAYADIVQDILYGIAGIIDKHGASFTSPITAIEFPKGVPLVQVSSLPHTHHS